MPRDKGDEPAFPTKLMLAIPSTFDSGNIPKEVEFPGMTLRDYFAAKAMQAILCGLKEGIRPNDCIMVAEDSYFIADAMLEAREEKRDAPE